MARTLAAAVALICSVSGCLTELPEEAAVVRDAVIVQDPPASEPTLGPVTPDDVLRQLREAHLGDAWSIARSTLTWSTLTVGFEDGMPANAAEVVWAEWTRPDTALTSRDDREVMSAIAQTVGDVVSKPGHVEDECVAAGFRIAITASNSTDPAATFVRISFRSAEFGEQTPVAAQPVVGSPTVHAVDESPQPVLATAIQPAAAVTNVSAEPKETHWRTYKSGKRHNSRCQWYGESNGHSCGPNDGIPCKICGG
jgi:hypothetical protein